MGQAVAIAIAVIAFIVGIAAGNPIVGLFGAIVVGGMAWLAFAWKPSADSQSQETPGDNADHSNNQKPHRVFSINDNEYHQPKAFGYLSVKTAHDLAVPTLKAWLNDATTDKKLFALIKARPATLELQLVAVLVAVHYTYVNAILKVPQDVLAEIRDGIAQGINTLTDGHQIAESIAHILQSSIANYVQALNQEIANPPEPGTWQPDCGSTSLTFTVLLGELYKSDDEYNNLVQQPTFVLDDMFLQHLVADAWVNLMNGLQKNLHLKFVS